MKKRVDIKTGFTCNNNCRFCVQAHKKKFGNRQKEKILKDLKSAFDNGCRDVVLTGGEVSIRDDFFELLRAAKTIGYETIQVQTNGRMFAYSSFFKKAVEAGMNEFSPAIHGHKKEIHEYLTRSPGSFDQVVSAIKNAQGIRIITNTVVVKPNYRYLPELARLLASLKVSQYQFAFMHAVGNAKTNFYSMMPRVSLAVPFIKKGLDIGIQAGIKVMAEAMPFCTMAGYEDYVSENFIPHCEIRDIDSFDNDFTKTRKEQGKMKFEKCKACRFYSRCEGPWKEYPEAYGDSEFSPV